ncbi:MAG: ketol-acid reductoisomerase [Planctomycetota bacterium]|jgi:ketol-acid reductoisomerase
MATIYYDEDADLRLLEGKTVGVIGYGNQGRAQALNMRDSGVDVLVGCRPDEYRERAVGEGFEVTGVAEAAERADVVLLLIPDEIQPVVYEESVLGGLGEGDALGFASGYNIYFGLVTPPEGVDVIMVAPRMIGSGVRARFLSGEGFPCLVAVGQDATDGALALTLALARAIGGTKAGAFASSFEEEVLIDLFAEQFLWAGINKLCRLYYDVLVEASCSPEAVATDLYLSGEMAEVAEAMMTEGFFRQLDLHSQTSQYGQLSRADTVLGERIQTRAREVLEGIRNGAFAQEWRQEQERGKPTLNRLKTEALAHPLNEVEQKLSGGKADA